MQGAPTGSSSTLAYIRSGALPARPAQLGLLLIITPTFAGTSFLLSAVAMVVTAYVWWWEPVRVKPVPPNPIPHVVVSPYDGDAAGADGLKLAERTQLAEQLRRRQGLSRDRAEMLDRLLADVGRRIGQFRLDSPDDSSLIATSRGRIELGDDTATFMPDGGKPVRLIRNVLYDGDAPPRWSALAMSEAIDEAYVITKGTLTSAQAGMLLTALGAQHPSSSHDWTIRPRIHAVAWEGGTISFRLTPQARDAEERWLLSDGRIAPVALAPFGVDPLTGIPYLRSTLLSYRYCPGSRAALVGVWAVSLIDAFLAAYLFVGAVLLVRDSLAGALRHVRYVCLKIPILILLGIATVWWLGSLRDFDPAPWPAGIRPELAFCLVLLATVAYLAAIVLLLRARSVRHYFAALGQSPGAEAQLMLRRISAGARTRVGHRLIRFTLVLIPMLVVTHMVAVAWCLMARPDARPQAWLHVIFCLLAFGVLGWIVIMAPAATAARYTATMIAVLLSAFCVGSSPQQGALSPWAIEGLLRIARGSDATPAADAIGQLARAGTTGQEALLQLLEGPEPHIGIDRSLSLIGEQWDDRDVLWAPQYRRRALRLTPEWIESIARGSEPSRMAVLEALGPADELEPLLRPVLLCRNDQIRRRAARLLLQINPWPSGVIAQLRRELTVAAGASSHAVIASLAHLRPASDATLARLMLDRDSSRSTSVMTALLDTNIPLSAPLVAAADQLADHHLRTVHEPALRLLTMSLDGRENLIQRSLAGSPRSLTAQKELLRIWPHIEPVFWRVAGSGRADNSDMIRSVAARVLGKLNESEGDIAALAVWAECSDEELRAQVCLVLAAGAYASRLGPATYRLVESQLDTPLIRPRDRPVWTAPVVEPQPAIVAPPPRWLSAGLCVVTVLWPLAVVPAVLGALGWRFDPMLGSEHRTPSEVVLGGVGWSKNG